MREIVSRIIRIKRERKYPVIFSDNVNIYRQLSKISRQAIGTNESLENLQYKIIFHSMSILKMEF